MPPGLDDLGLTTMAQDFDGIGKTAGGLILSRIADPAGPCVAEVFPARLVVRHSSLGYEKRGFTALVPAPRSLMMPALAGA